jgi:dihydropteroate synthase
MSQRVSVTLDRPRILAILNVTPDSFSDGGAHLDPARALQAVRRFVGEGADIIDIGGESTRPGASAVPWRDQCERVLPVISLVRADPDERVRAIPITIDTTSSLVARAALEAGADAVNDVSAGMADPEMLGVCASRGAGIVLMHRAMEPAKDAYSDQYQLGAAPMAGSIEETVESVRSFLRERARVATASGIRGDAIVIDPGLGFGKTVEQNLALIEATPTLSALGFPVLSGLSRKRFVGRVMLGRASDPEERIEGTVRMSMAHAVLGASILRVHDVAEHVAAMKA